jgi:SAM-dependent methyltransferase
LERFGVSTLWDVGAGTGSMAVRLRERGFEVVAVEPLAAGAEAIGARGIPSFCSTLERLGLPGGSLESIGIFDVLEHLPDPLPLLEESRRVLRHDGLLTVTVPAHQWLWSEADEVSGHQRRYSGAQLRAIAEEAGFSCVESRHIFASFVPMAAVLRALPYRLHRRRGRREVLEDLGRQLHPSPRVDRVARKVLRCERRVGRRGLPVGLSVLAAFRPSPAVPGS